MKLSLVLFALLFGMVLSSSLVDADNLVADGDNAVPILSHSVDLGDLCLGGPPVSASVLLGISRQGSAGGTNTFANGASVAVSAQSVTGAGLSNSMSADTSIILPANWTTLANTTISADTASGVVTYGPAASPLVFSGNATFRASGLNTSGAIINRDATVAVSANVIACDSSPPQITPSVNGTLGSNGWYTSNVQVSWSVIDPESSVTSSTGCSPTTISSDTSGTTLTCSATSAGGSNSQSVTVKRDATKPSVLAAINSGTLGADSWYVSDVGVHFTCNDATSGVASCPTDQTLSSEGSSVFSVAQAATDNAGNLSDPSNVVTVKIDKTAPSVTLNAAGTAGANGWYTSNVIISTSGVDLVSGIASCVADQFQNTETTGTTFTGTCSNDAGLVGNGSLMVKVDKTPPTAVLSVSSGTLGTNGWYTSNVTISTNGTDSISTPVVCTANQNQTTDTVGTTFNGSCTNNAGLSTNAAPLSVKVDKTPPVVTVTGVANGSTYVLGSVPIAGCNTTDATSGVATAATVAFTGGPLVGAFTATCNGSPKDNAGNIAPAVSLNYNVIFNWSGFFQPIDKMPTLNAVNAGRAIPIKFGLGGNQGLNIFAANSPSSAVVPCGATAPEDLVEETVTAGNSSLSYDATANQYVYVWKTEGSWAGQCRQLTVTLIDGTTHKALFRFK